MTEPATIIEKHFKLMLEQQLAIDALTEQVPQISRQKLKLAMKYGAVWLTSPESSSKTVRLRRHKKRLSVGTELHLYFNEKTLFSEINPAILVADVQDYSVWNKPSGMFSQGTKWGDHTSICRWIELFGFEREGIESRPVFLVHRLDRATNGLIIVAHSKSTARQLANKFELREIDKTYSAVVHGEFPVNKLREITSDIDGRKATTIVQSCRLNSLLNQSILTVKLGTGRKHQIRKHLSSVGYPILHDRLYGRGGIGKPMVDDSTLISEPDLKLRSCKVAIICPVSNKLRSFEIPGYQ